MKFLKKYKKTYLHSGIWKGNSVITNRGKVPIEDLRITDQVLTDDKKFVSIKNIQKSKRRGFYIIHTFDFKDIYVDERSSVCVRDVKITMKDRNPAPIISNPHWVSLKNIDLTKHILLSPYNPHSINPYAIYNFPVSTYKDEEKKLWIQIESIEHVNDVRDIYRIELEDDNGIGVEHLIVK